ncbi:MAG: protein kinase [Archangiaceae bacterium]|nr:protein kinase [Archangiaceae bacterium]
MPCPHSPGDGPCSLCDAADPQVATFLSDPKAKAPVDADGLDWGTHVDRYIVQDLLGRGGMGLVYVATDPDLGRQVAIKLLRGSAAPGDAASLGQARMLREAQAMAQLSHPNVMPIYDVGKYERSVFIAMELVRGLTLDKWVRAQQHAWREVLQMFLQAGRGLEAAHAAGLVHRDFKPANVLIGEDGRPRVTDFGIARSVRASAAAANEVEPDTARRDGPISSGSLDTPLTRAGSLMGSPGYMAPEQYAGLETSPATDQFSFCVALYEGLYGARPFGGTTFAELAHSTTLARVPAAPKGSSVPVWLHRVLERGLSADPLERYPSMTALLEALAHDPAQKLKNRLAAGAVAGVVVALGALAVGLTLQQRQACRGADRLLDGVWDEAARARGKAAFEATGKSYAPLAWEHAATEMDAYGAAWVKARTEACEATRTRGEQSEAVMARRFDCLDRRRAELAALAQAYATADVETVDRAYGAASRLSDIEGCAHLREGRKQAPPEARAALEQFGRALAEGRALASAGRFDVARGHLDEALQVTRALALPAQRAEVELALGELELDARRFPASNEALQRAVQFAEAAADDETSAAALTAMVSLVGWRLERPEEGRSLASIAQGKLERLGGDARVAAELAEGLGDTEWQAARRDVALQHYRDALKKRTALEGADGLDVARLHSSIGWVLTEQGALSEARTELMASKATREKLLGPEHPTLIASWNELGTLAMSMDDGAEAIRCFERSMVLSRAALGGDSLSTTRMAMNLASALARFGRAAETDDIVTHTREVLELHPEAPVSHRVQYAQVRVQVALAEGRWVDAEKVAREALPLSEAALGHEHPSTQLFAMLLGRALAGQQRWAAALEQFDRYLEIAEHLKSTRDPDCAWELAESAVPLQKLGRGAEAVERLERALATFPAPEDGGNRRRAARVRLMLAEALPLGDKARARTLAGEARAVLEAEGAAGDARRAEAFLERTK